MLVVAKARFKNDIATQPWLPEWVDGYCVGFDHLPMDRRMNWGLAGGYIREIDAKIAELTIRGTYPEFDFDHCTQEQFDAFVKEVTFKKIQQIMTECLQW